MNKRNNTRHPSNTPKKNSRAVRIVTVIIALMIIVCIALFFHHRAKVNEQRQLTEEAYREAEYRKREAQRERERIEEVRNRRIEDSIRIANMPSYSLADVREMVMAKVPSYSWAYLWRKDNDNWLMNYMREYGGKEHWFYQRFNPTTGKFHEAIEYATIYYPNDDEDEAVYTHPKNVRCSVNEKGLGRPSIIMRMAYIWESTADMA